MQKELFQNIYEKLQLVNESKLDFSDYEMFQYNEVEKIYSNLSDQEKKLLDIMITYKLCDDSFKKNIIQPDQLNVFSNTCINTMYSIFD